MQRKKEILLVDDEVSILNSFSKEFKLAGYGVTTAESGEEAIAILQNYYFDIVITDLALSGVDGIKVLKEAKEQNPMIGGVILTGYGEMSSAIEALRMGADDYLLKPCDSDILLLRVEMCIKKQEAFQKIKLYETILPICMFCKKIRDDTGCEHGKGKWMSLESYFYYKSGVDLSHGICPECYKIHKQGV